MCVDSVSFILEQAEITAKTAMERQKTNNFFIDDYVTHLLATTIIE